MVLIGRPNVGKTLLLINFAAYLGVTEISCEGPEPSKIPFEQARRRYVSYVAHKQVAPLQAHVAPSKLSDKSMILVDTPGIAEGIVADPRVRQAMAEGLEQLFRAHMILLVVDGGTEAITPLDDELLALAVRIAPTLIVDNKTDLASGFHPAAHREHFAGHPVLPFSALTRRGFRDLKQRLLAQWEAEG